MVIPVYNEEENLPVLHGEILRAMAGSGRSWEVLYVDDGSTDTSPAILSGLAYEDPRVRVIRQRRNSGQSAALDAGFRHARGGIVVTLDADLQNDPADIPRLLERIGEYDVVSGVRTRRQDSWIRKVSSRVANAVRASMLRDGTPDTGCGIKLMHRATFLQLPHFNHMHRFLPALYQRAGARVISVPVRHRPRTRGISKYGLRNRLWVGIVDLFGVRWLIRRKPAQVQITEQ